jgi:S-adenosylmethionine:tRNA ribosyltransferase-isomerase
MQLSDFNFDLPEELIARYPLETRSSSRLLCVSKQTGDVSHQNFIDLLDLLKPNDLLILNNTRVIPARLFGQKKTGGKVELLIERILSPTQALTHLRTSKSLKEGTEILFANDVVGILEEKQEEFWQIRFNQDVLDILYAQGEIPLPHYFKRTVEESDKTRYQTVFAEKEGAVAAPTAGLHFDDNMFAALKEKNIKTAFVTLHVGAGTFKPIRVEDFTQHKMHYEWMKIEEETCRLIKETKQLDGRIIAVGTTSVRSLESMMSKHNEVKAFEGDTNLFIYPGFKFKLVDAIITNFHLPKTSLLLLISAFASKDIILNAYQQAIKEQYRFFSYGDAMFID